MSDRLCCCAAGFERSRKGPLDRQESCISSIMGKCYCKLG